MPIYEAQINEINYRTGKCSLLTRGAGDGDGSVVSGVPIPNIAGVDDSGLFVKWKVGTRVVVTTSDNSSNSVPKILATIPSDFLYEDSGKRIPLDAPPGTVRYPHIDHNSVDPNTPDIVMHGGLGSRFQILPTGDIQMVTNKNTGSLLYNTSRGGAMYNSAGIIYTNSSAHRSWNGVVRRMKEGSKNAYIAPTPRDNLLMVDTSLHAGGVMGGIKDLGIFTGTAAWNISKNSKSGAFQKNRNPRLAESVSKYYEFTTDSMFSGFQSEAARMSGEISTNDMDIQRARDRTPGNSLHMPERELVEVIVGNLIDINGDVLDINFRRVISGGPGNKFPKDGSLDSINQDIIYAEKMTRRGVGYHFQLSTNSSSTMPSESQSNFVFDIDKEGVFKLNVPKSSGTGNVPFATKTSYLSDGDSPIVVPKNPSKFEPVPVTLRKKDGTVQYPASAGGGGAESMPSGVRGTGVEYVNIGESKYFPSKDETSDRQRINCTAYHNMYSIAERAIANTVQYVSVPYVKGTRLNGLPVMMGMSPFEIPNDGSVDVYEYMSCVKVAPSVPAMNPGSKSGTVSVAGNPQQVYRSFSNSFDVRTNEKGDLLTANIGSDDYESTVNSGGKSANINFEGQVDLSIGKDNHDQKSLVIDTQSTVLAWLGKPSLPESGPSGAENDRSLVLQSDGSILINVGGTYSGDFENKEDLQDPDGGVTFNKGRLDIRVNVSDKGLVGAREGDELKGDFLISISEHGLVIAGMAKDKPMVIRNDGEINIESASKISLNGGSGGIDFVGGTGKVTTLKDIEHQ